MKNYYRILNVRTTATEEEIKASYRTLAKRYHPDLNPDDASSARRFSDINEAYDVLSDAKKRAEYNTQFQNAAPPRRSSYSGADRAGAYQRQYQDPAQMQAQIQAQVQAQVQAQINEARNQAYTAGYERGYTDGNTYAQKNAAAESEKLKRKVSEYSKDRSELEQELFDRDRQLTQADNQIKELQLQLQWLRKAAGPHVKQNDVLSERIEQAETRVQELQKEIDKLDMQPVEISHNPSAKHKDCQRLKERLGDFERQLSDLSTELDGLNLRYKQEEQRAESKELYSSLEARAAEWSKKVRADARLAKSTLYGTLGVLIWATDADIDAEYEKLAAHYTAGGDAESEKKLQKLKSAYAVLADPKQRREYNEQLGYPPERIAEERRIYKEIAAWQEDYRNKLAQKEFWARFDQLAALALADDADAQNALGEIYYFGRYVRRDLSQAVYWFKEAFAQMHPAAMYRLGMCYIGGEGVSRNKGIGFALLRQAKNLGYKPPKA